MMIVPLLALLQTVEQIAPPPSPAAAVRAEQASAAAAPRDPAVTQLPPIARRVRQPDPRPPAPPHADGVDVARTYQILSPSEAPLPSAPRELGPDTIAGIAAQLQAVAPAARPLVPGPAGTPPIVTNRR